jgi:hypothetical protein
MLGNVPNRQMSTRLLAKVSQLYKACGLKPGPTEQLLGRMANVSQAWSDVKKNKTKQKWPRHILSTLVRFNHPESRLLHLPKPIASHRHLDPF